MKAIGVEVAAELRESADLMATARAEIEHLRSERDRLAATVEDLGFERDTLRRERDAAYRRLARRDAQATEGETP